MTTPQTILPDGGGSAAGDGDDQQREEDVVSSFLSGGLSEFSSTKNGTSGTGSACGGTVPSKKAGPEAMPAMASPLLGATEAADAQALGGVGPDVSDGWRLNDWGLDSAKNNTIDAAAQSQSTAAAAAAAASPSSDDRDVLGGPPSPDDASRSTTPPDREVYPSSAAVAAAAKRRQFQAQTETQAQTQPQPQPSFTANRFAAPDGSSSSADGAAQPAADVGLSISSPLRTSQQHPPPSMPPPRPQSVAITPQQPPQPQSEYMPHQQQLGTVGTFTNSVTGRVLTVLSQKCIPSRLRPTHSGSALAGFLSLLLVTCSSYMLSPMRDAAALAVGVDYIPALTLASTVLALASSVPVGWLFEAPNPERRGRFFNRVGLTRGETQGTSLALFYRCFALCLVGYAVGFKIVEMMGGTEAADDANHVEGGECPAGEEYGAEEEGQCGAMLGETEVMASMLPLGLGGVLALLKRILARIVKSRFGKLFYVAFFLVVHLMKLHSLSLIWGVTSEAMEYEEQAEKRERERLEELAAAAASAAGPSRRYSAPHYTLHGSHPAHKHRPVLSSIPSGEVAPTNLQHQEAEQERRRQQQRQQEKPGSRSRARLKRLAFVGFGGTLGGILGSVIASGLARTLHISGLLVVAAILLELSAELSIELGKIMLRHWQEEQIRILSCGDLPTLGLQSAGTSLASLAENKELEGDDVDSSMKRVASLGSMKRIASGNSISSMQRVQSTASLVSDEVDSSMKRITSLGSMKRIASGHSLSGMQRARSAASLSSAEVEPPAPAPTGMKRSAKSMSSLADAGRKRDAKSKSKQQREEDSVATSATDQSDVIVEDTSFKARLLRGFKTILRSRLLMCIFTYNALGATTSVLLSFQRAELVANRTVEAASTERDTAFLANVNMASSVAVFALQVSGLGAFVASSCGQYGTLVLMPTIRMFGVLMLAWWHVQGAGQAPNLALFLLLDEFTKVMNFAVAKPVRESLWRGLSAEARYDAKPIVDTLANRWGGGSAAFLTSAIGHIMATTSVGKVAEDGTKTLFGFPPVLILCSIAAVWWAVVSVDLGGIRMRIDAELKKQQ